MRISCTLIDQWLRFQREEYVSEADLQDSIKGVFKPSRKMLCGMSFDKIIQNPQKYQTEDGYECEGISWPGGEMEEKVLPLFQEIVTWQPKEIRSYILDGTPVNVVTKADGLQGNGVIEVKTAWSGFDYDRYQDSHQWRHYLLGFEAQWVRYHVFCWTEPASGPFKLQSVETFTLYPYLGIERDCVEALTELVGYIKRKGLERFVADDRDWTKKEVA